jgi:hypothetical protein
MAYELSRNAVDVDLKGGANVALQYVQKESFKLTSVA